MNFICINLKKNEIKVKKTDFLGKKKRTHKNLLLFKSTTTLSLFSVVIPFLFPSSLSYATLFLFFFSDTLPIWVHISAFLYWTNIPLTFHENYVWSTCMYIETWRNTQLSIILLVNLIWPEIQICYFQNVDVNLIFLE